MKGSRSRTGADGKKREAPMHASEGRGTKSVGNTGKTEDSVTSSRRGLRSCAFKEKKRAIGYEATVLIGLGKALNPGRLGLPAGEGN